MADFLTLSEASDRLNVHPTTLRRWADHGDILVMVTPGGHRRFPVTEIERLKLGSGSANVEDSIEVLIQNALSSTREGLKDSSRKAWVDSMDEEEKNQKRESGREVMALLSEFIKSDNDDERILNRAKELGAEYGHGAYRSGMTMSTVVTATMFFRDKIIEAISSGEERGVVVDALRRTHNFLNSLLIAATDAFEADR